MAEENQDRLEEIKKWMETPNSLTLSSGGDLALGGAYIIWLIQEVKRLREGIDRISKQANGMIIVDESEKIESMKKDLEDLTGVYNKRYASHKEQADALAETIASLTKELEVVKKERTEWKYKAEKNLEYQGNRISELEAENAELKEEVQHECNINEMNHRVYGKEIAELKKKVRGWEKRAEFLRKFYTQAAKDGSLTWDKIDKVITKNN